MALLLLTALVFAHYTTAAASPTILTDTHELDNHYPEVQTEHTEIPQIHDTGFPPSTDLSVVPRDQQTPGSSCPGSEGQWNCMTNSWQRCAAGKWSVVMQCAVGTACVPAGLTYDFKVQFSGQGTGTGSSTSSGERSLRLSWLLASVVVAAIVKLCG